MPAIPIRLVCFAIAVYGSAAAQQPGLASAKALDREISALKNLPGAERDAAVKNIAARVRQQPNEFAVALAFNLAVDGVDGSAVETLQQVADTLADALIRSPKPADESAYIQLAELVRYNDLRTSLDHPQYAAAIAKLAGNDKHRAAAGFTLRDLHGKTWSLKRLRGKVVIVNFWATWCPPCRAELPDLEQLRRQFKSKGLVILAISDEDAAKIKKFAAEYPVNYPLLLDPGAEVKDLFRVRGIPQTFVYDRQGRLVAHTPGRPSMPRFLTMLERAGLR